jgi:hypothetical protein
MNEPRNRAARSLRAAVQAAGGLDWAASQVSEGFASGDSPARRALTESLRLCLAELGWLNEVAPESNRAAQLRDAIARAPGLLHGIECELEAAGRRQARSLLLMAMGGDRAALRSLAARAGRVGPAFARAIVAADEDDDEEDWEPNETEFDLPIDDDDVAIDLRDDDEDEEEGVLCQPGRGRSARKDGDQSRPPS